MITAFEKARTGSRRQQLAGLLMLFSILVSAGESSAALDLRNASVSQLNNGLTVILLEDRNFAVASVQMLYRVGARNEVSGQTGLAHFLEHMAFRDSENFPDTGLVRSIYAAGGEWHGYTWLDQTTYFATVPEDRLDLLLRIEADRMTRLELSPDDMVAERGAVLAEMHMYENLPTSMLIDAVMSVSFLAHPYRNNTIGWQSDIENLGHAAVLEFYRRHYHPANAVLAVVGDFDRRKLIARIEKLFGDFPRKQETPLPHTREPLQRGERRVRLYDDTGERQFMIGYRAPAVGNPDYAAFVVLQQLLGASSGAGFLQNDWGTPIEDGSALYGAADALTTWFPPSEQDFVFMVGGYAPPGKSEHAVEDDVERRIASLRRRAPTKQALSAAVERVLDELVYDLETTEDAAHQLAFFGGMHALDILLALPDLVAAVAAADVQRVAATYLLPERRTIAWRLPGQAQSRGQGTLVSSGASAVVERDPPESIDTNPVSAPVVRKLRGGIPAIVMPSDLSPSAHVRVVIPGDRVSAAAAIADDPLNGYSSLVYRIRPGRLSATLELARDTMKKTPVERAATASPSMDPATRLEQVFGDVAGRGSKPAGKSANPALIVISGDVDAEETIALLERHFGGLQPSTQEPGVARGKEPKSRVVHLGKPLAQAHLGYIVRAPGPRDAGFDATRLLLYILSHGYEGRLGKAAISERGLAYYIDGRYRSNGHDGWVTLSVGVDPDKFAALKDLVMAELRRLSAEPPTIAEVEEAKSHLLGRARSAAQSNAELTAALARQWLMFGDVLSPDALARRLAAVTHADVLDNSAAFVDGTLIEIRE